MSRYAGAAPRSAAPADAAGPVLRVRDLCVRVRHKELLTDVDLTVSRGERVGLIGESGSGKSLTALSVMGLLPEALHPSGSVTVASRAGRPPRLSAPPSAPWPGCAAATSPWSSRSR